MSTTGFCPAWASQDQKPDCETEAVLWHHRQLSSLSWSWPEPSAHMRSDMAQLSAMFPLGRGPPHDPALVPKEID